MRLAPLSLSLEGPSSLQGTGLPQNHMQEHFLPSSLTFPEQLVSTRNYQLWCISYLSPSTKENSRKQRPSLDLSSVAHKENTNKHARLDGEKLIDPQPYTKNYKQLSKAGNQRLNNQGT